MTHCTPQQLLHRLRPRDLRQTEAHHRYSIRAPLTELQIDALIMSGGLAQLKR
jgi:hypothetical protein